MGAGGGALGLLDADHGDPVAAVARLRAEWARGHRSVGAADALGWALFRAGRAKEALEYAKRATEEGLRSALFSYHRGEIERALELRGPARRHLAEALRINPSFSPLHAPRAEAALAALGEPPDELPEGWSRRTRRGRRAREAGAYGEDGSGGGGGRGEAAAGPGTRA